MALFSLTAFMPGASAAVGAATVGLCLIFVEMNRPGRILPGAAGLLLLLLSIGRLAKYPLRPWAVGLLLFSLMGLLANVWRRLPIILLLAAAVGLCLGLVFLGAPGGSGQVDVPVALLCGGGIAALSGFLTRVARHARRLKAID